MNKETRSLVIATAGLILLTGVVASRLRKYVSISVTKLED